MSSLLIKFNNVVLACRKIEWAIKLLYNRTDFSICLMSAVLFYFKFKLDLGYF